MTEEEKYSDAWKRRKFWSRLDSGLLVLITFFGVFVPLLVFAVRKHFPPTFIVFAVIWLSANFIIYWYTVSRAVHDVTTAFRSLHPGQGALGAFPIVLIAVYPRVWTGAVYRPKIRS